MRKWPRSLSLLLDGGDDGLAPSVTSQNSPSSCSYTSGKVQIKTFVCKLLLDNGRHTLYRFKSVFNVVNFLTNSVRHVMANETCLFGFFSRVIYAENLILKLIFLQPEA